MIETWRTSYKSFSRWSPGKVTYIYIYILYFFNLCRLSNFAWQASFTQNDLSSREHKSHGTVHILWLCPFLNPPIILTSSYIVLLPARCQFFCTNWPLCTHISHQEKQLVGHRRYPDLIFKIGRSFLILNSWFRNFQKETTYLSRSSINSFKCRRSTC